MMDNLERVLTNQSLKSFVYTDRGSLISLSKEDSVGTLMGRLMGNVNVHGFLAKVIYTSLYRSHQFSIHGFYKTAVLIVSDLLGRSTGQRTKLH
jgi:NADH dehydrogenase